MKQRITRFVSVATTVNRKKGDCGSSKHILAFRGFACFSVGVFL